MMDIERLEKEARKFGIIEPAKLKRGVVVFLECDNDLMLELVATDPIKKTFTASANFGTLTRPQPVEILGAVAPGDERTIIRNFIAKDLRVALKIRGRLKVLPVVRHATIRGAGWSYDMWSD